MMMMVEKSDKGSGGAASPREIVLGVGEEKGSASVRTAETLLRILPMALCVTALMTMLKNSQDNSYGAVSYSDVGGFRYLVYANGICAGYSLLSAFCTAMPHSATISWAWTVFFFDQVLTYMILAAGTVSAEVMYLAYKGDEAITWSDACESFGGFCKKATASVAITFVVVACYAGLSLISSYRLFSNYKPPIDCPGKEIESAHFTG